MRALHRPLDGEGLPQLDLSVDSQCKLMDYDWVYRQLVLYEYGALRHFLDQVASPSLIERADSIREWATVPMGAYRLVETDSRKVRWLDLAKDVEVETANIGSASLVPAGGNVIGRLVPTRQGQMFESAPILVPPDVASRVAEEPDGWTLALMRGCQRSGDQISTRTPGFPLLSDVPAAFEIDLVEHVLRLEDGRSWVP